MDKIASKISQVHNFESFGRSIAQVALREASRAGNKAPLDKITIEVSTQPGIECVTICVIVYGVPVCICV